MKAALLQEFNKPLVIGEAERPKIGPDEVLVRVKACGICYSDVRLWKGEGLVKPKLPHILGHEVAGVVEEVGGSVKDLKEGDRVTVYVYAPCDKCAACLSGNENLCTRMSWFLGFTDKGGFAEYVAVPQRSVIRIPEDIRFEDAAILPDAILTPYHTVMGKARVRAGEDAVVIGIGGLGVNAVQILKAVGLRVIAVSRTQAKLEFSKKMGADYIVNSRETKAEEEVRKITDGEGADYVFDFACTPETISIGLKSLKRGGKLVMAAYNPLPLPAETQMLLVREQIHLIGSRGGTRKELLEVIKLLREGRLKSTVTDVRPLEDVNELLMRLADGSQIGRAVVKI